MSWHQLHLQCQKAHVDLAEALLMEEGAVSIVLEDAGDQPLFEPIPGESPLWDDVILTGIFIADDHPASDLETISHQVASQVQASRVWLSSLEDKDWEREWMTHYQPIECANDLWIVPKWLTPPNPKATNIIMDPGLAFGTGYHATTRLCLDWLSESAALGNLKDKVIIDYGCGSGILGIAALLLGAKHVYAVDIDPQAVLATKQNAERNQVESSLTSCLPDEFQKLCQNENILPVDMVVANILAKPLITLAPYFATLLKNQGEIVLSGLIKEQVDDVKDAYSPFFQMMDAYGFMNKDDEHWQRLSGKLQSSHS